VVFKAGYDEIEL